MSWIKKDTPFEVRRFIISLTIPLICAILFWVVKGFEILNETRFYQWGIYPRSLDGLKGILFAPFLHSDLNHLTGNTISFLVLSVSLFYFYPRISLKVFWQVFLFSHFMLWIGGRESWHIGASVLVYGFAAFLFVSGVIRRYIPLLAIAMLVVFWYGGMIWHIFPMEIDDPISWEGHLFGAITGSSLAIFYRKQGPQRPPWSWELHEEINDEDLPEEERYWEIPDKKEEEQPN